MRYIKGLRIDLDAGEGRVSMPPEFTGRSGQFKMDVLGDWIFGLEGLYEKAMVQMNAETEAAVAEIVEREAATAR